MRFGSAGGRCSAASPRRVWAGICSGATHAKNFVERGAPLGKTESVTSQVIADTRNDLNYYGSSKPNLTNEQHVCFRTIPIYKFPPRPSTLWRSLIADCELRCGAVPRVVPSPGQR